MASGRKQKPTTANDLMMMRTGLRAQIPDSPSLSISSRAPQHYLNSGYENTESFGAGHYEDLDRYNQIPTTSPRKTNNAIYQQATPLSAIPPDIKIQRHRQFTECSDDSTSSLMHSSSKSSRSSTIILAFILLASVVALALVILMITGVIKASTDCGCDANSATNTKRYLTKLNQPSISTTLLVQKMNMLERNVSSLLAREAIMASLVHFHEKEILELKSKLRGESQKEESSANKFKQNITTEVKNLREKQAQIDSSLTKLKESDKVKATDIQEMSAKVLGLAVAVNFLSLNDSLIKSKVHKLSQAEVEFRSSLEALKQKDAEVDTSMKRAKGVEAFLNSSVGQLKSIDGQMKTKMNLLNSTFMREINAINDTVNKMQGGAGPPGPPGPQGPRGIPGTPGAGNLSQCQHQQKKSEGNSAATTDYFVTFIEPKGKIVVGATCSSMRGDETFLSSKTNKQGQKVYLCTCRGLSNFASGSGVTKCFLDVWMCPRIS